MDNIIGLASLCIFLAIAEALIKCPAPTPLEVTMITVGLILLLPELISYPQS
jgi:hypothetical protein